ncbi:hypothetical protein AVEN_62161-1, partial [Araneus ventricosus]
EQISRNAVKAETPGKAGKDAHTEDATGEQWLRKYLQRRMQGISLGEKNEQNGRTGFAGAYKRVSPQSGKCASAVFLEALVMDGLGIF